MLCGNMGRLQRKTSVSGHFKISQPGLKTIEGRNFLSVDTPPNGCNGLAGGGSAAPPDPGMNFKCCFQQ